LNSLTKPPTSYFTYFKSIDDDAQDIMPPTPTLLYDMRASTQEEVRGFILILSPEICAMSPTTAELMLPILIIETVSSPFTLILRSVIVAIHPSVVKQKFALLASIAHPAAAIYCLGLDHAP